MNNTDRIGSLFLIALCVVFYILAQEFSPYSKLFPQVIIFVLGGLSVLLFIMSFIMPQKSKAIKLGVKYIPPFISLICLIAWAAFINIVGFWLTSVIFFSIIIVYLDRRRDGTISLLKKIGLGVILITSFYFFFSRFLNVPFPSGILF